MKVELRPLVREDHRAVHQWARLEQSSRYQVWGPNTSAQTRSFVDEAVAAWARSPQERYVYAVSVDGAVVGLGELNVRSVLHRQGEIGYSVHPDRWGRGIGTRIGHALVEIGFGRLDLHRIFATCDPRNMASARVLAKIGMTHEGRLRQVLCLRDGWRDSDIFGILRHEWSGRRPA